jgi:hypothetical protein
VSESRAYGCASKQWIGRGSVRKAAVSLGTSTVLVPVSAGIRIHRGPPMAPIDARPCLRPHRFTRERSLVRNQPRAHGLLLFVSPSERCSRRPRTRLPLPREYQRPAGAVRQSTGNRLQATDAGPRAAEKGPSPCSDRDPRRPAASGPDSPLPAGIGASHRRSALPPGAGRCPTPRRRDPRMRRDDGSAGR